MNTVSVQKMYNGENGIHKYMCTLLTHFKEITLHTLLKYFDCNYLHRCFFPFLRQNEQNPDYCVPLIRRLASFFFFGARIWLGTILGRFSIIYFSELGLRIRVRIRVRVRVGVRVSGVI